MLKPEVIYPLESVNCFINEDLIVYPATDNGEPDLSQWNELANLTSEFVNRISYEDDTLISDLIYWKIRLTEEFNLELN